MWVASSELRAPRERAESMPVVAVILAGGTGSRFGAERPKQLVPLAGRPILQHTVSKFDDCAGVTAVVVAFNPRWHEEIERICRKWIFNKPWHMCAGGETRNHTVRNVVTDMGGFEAKVLLHDAVRPLVTPSLINRVADALDVSDSVIPVIPSVDPLIKVDGGSVTEFADRATVLRGQSPQGFWLSHLRAAFETASDEDLSHYGTVFEVVRSTRAAFGISTVEGDMNNMKITLPVDYVVAGRLLLED